MDLMEKQLNKLLKALMENRYSPQLIGEAVKTTIASENPVDTVNRIVTRIKMDANEKQILDLIQIILKEQYK